MDGETSSMDESAILGSHPWMEKCHPRMEKCHPWMSSMDGGMSSMDGSIIHGCHSWMTLPSVDAIHGWRRQITDMDTAYTALNYQLIRKKTWAPNFRKKYVKSYNLMKKIHQEYFRFQHLIEKNLNTLSLFNKTQTWQSILHHKYKKSIQYFR